MIMIRLRYDGGIDVKKAGILLCGILSAALLSGCGNEMIDLTQEETEIITEYAVGVMIKHDRRQISRLVDTTAYDVADEETPEEKAEEISEEKPEQEKPEQENSTDNTEVIDVSQDVETLPSTTIEEYYGIEGITFQYLGHDLMQSYPSNTGDESLFFAMDATAGMQLLVLRFVAANVSSTDQTLNMLAYGARFRVSVNGGAGQNVLTTMLLDDMQTYNDVLPAGSSVELVSIVEVPQGESVETISLMLRGGDENAALILQ